MNMTNAKQDEEGFVASKIRVRLTAGREKQSVRGSAWVFSGAIEEVEGAGAAGEAADVFDAEGEFLGRGLWHPEADMTVRMFTQDPAEQLDEAFFRGRIRRAVAMRHRLFGARADWQDTNAYRMVFSEADGLSDVLGFWKEKSMYGKTYMGMERTTLLADADGRIVRIWPKVKVAGHAQEVLDAAKALG